jgi:hypothetical protein
VRKHQEEKTIHCTHPWHSLDDVREFGLDNSSKDLETVSSRLREREREVCESEINRAKSEVHLVEHGGESWRASRASLLHDVVNQFQKTTRSQGDLARLERKRGE